jgi:hypothetical protein
MDDIILEIKKCMDSPYYFATKYIVIENKNGEKVPFKTPWTEDEFNKIFNNINHDKEIH